MKGVGVILKMQYRLSESICKGDGTLFCQFWGVGVDLSAYPNNVRGIPSV